MKDPNSTLIAGSKTAGDWRALRPYLIENASEAMWSEVASSYFHERLFRRYMAPIACLQQNGTLQGEGFSIAAIQCSLIEFLESTVLGLNYRFLRSGESLGEYEYSSSRGLFVKFLTQRSPFRESFPEPLAQSFYENVRCGLLHEARTKSGWKIWAKSCDGSFVDANNYVLYRDDFQAALLAFIDNYEVRLPKNVCLQEAFIRKFDGLAAI